MSSKTQIPIVFSIDDNWVVPGMVALNSLLLSANASTSYHIHILHIELSEVNRLRIANNLDRYENHELKFIYCGDYLNTGFEVRNITKTAYLRLLIPRVLPEFTKVLYTDVDVVVTDDLTPIFHLDIGENAFAGVPTDIISKSYLKKIGATSSYINSGVVLIQSSQITNEEVESCIDHVKTGKYKYLDQDIINIVFKHKTVATIPPRFNITPNRFNKVLDGNTDFLKKYYSEEQIANILERRGVIHYTGNKPWNSPNVYLSDLWWHFYHLSSINDDEFYFSYQKKVKKGIKLF